jgi:ribosome biogenesis GTPase
MLEQGYPEIEALLGRCRFNDCQHRVEPGCVIQTSLVNGEIHPERLANYQHMAQSLNG